MIDNRLNLAGTLHKWAQGVRDPSTGDYADTFDTTKDRPVRCDLRQQSTTENRKGGGVVTTVSWLLFVEAGVPDIDSKDEVTVEGMGRWAFEGDPWLVRNPRTTRALHWQGIVRKVN